MLHHVAVACVLLCIVFARQELVKAWGEFLSQFSWDWFVTLTFREEVGSFRAHRLFGYFVRDLEKAAGHPIFWFRADEIGPHGGRFHIHALIGNVAHLRRMTWVDGWDRLAGWARILPFDSKRGAAYYTAKYVAKQSGDWEISENLAAFSQYQPVLPLDGMVKPKPPQAVGSDIELRPEPRKPPTQPQLSLPHNFQSPVPDRTSRIGQVYRSEVTRGRGRFREFFPPK
jgi:hypothetical protein